jgi:pimeloyl-ACP methyl ester carboxylesterase
MPVSLHLRPEPYLYSEWVPLRASGLAPGQIVTLELEHIDDVGQRWRATAELSADATGAIDTADAPSRRGSYLGTSRDGLLWSMAPDGVTDFSDRTAFMALGRSYMHMVGQPGGEKLQPRLHTLRVRDGSRVLAEGTFSQTRLGPGVRVEELAEGPVRGLAFHPAPGAVPARGAVLSLTGSGGGVENSWAPLLASHGIPVLSAATFAWPGRPELMQHIDLAYFEQAALWMRQHFGVQRIAVQGGSRGGELTLVLAAYRPDLFCGGVAMVPFHNVVAGFDHLRNVHEQPSWVLNGQPLPYADVRVTLSGPEAVHTPDGIAVAPDYQRDAASAEADARCGIPVERCSGPLLLLSGRDDAMWPSAYGGDRVIDRLRHHGLAHRAEHLAFENVGHYLVTPGQPTTMCASLYHPLAKITLACGGQPRATAEAGRTSLERMLRFYGELFAD